MTLLKDNMICIDFLDKFNYCYIVKEEKDQNILKLRIGLDNLL
jgi:hypothetical protein